MSNRQLVGSGIHLGLFLAASLAVLGLAGCGGGGGGESGTSASEVAAASVAFSNSAALSATAVSSAQIDLAWTASTRATGYEIRRNDTRIATIGNVTTYEDTGLSPSTAYSYQVVAIYGAWNFLGRSNVAVATTLAADTTPPMVSSTSPADAATAVAVNSAITATFSEVMLKSTLNAITFELATLQGVPVTGVVSASSTTATFTPSADLAANTQYIAILTTGVTDSAGNALAANFRLNFTTGTAPDTTPPTVSSTAPENAATGVALNSSVSASFSEAMMNSTLTSASFQVKDTSGGALVSGTVSVSGNTATYKPSVPLVASTQYTATISTGARDAAGNALAAGFTWNFGTAAAVDVTPPQVISTLPANATTGVALNSSVSATFSEAMTNSTLTTASFGLKATGGAAVSGTVVVSGNSVVFKPANSLSAGSQYTATITTAAKDLAGNPLANIFNWTFTTAAALDKTPPTVSATSPANAASGVAVTSSVSANFSEPMTNSTLTTASVTLAKTTGGTAVAGTVSVIGNSATFTPSASLVAGTQYTATISTAVQDAAGNALAADFVWNFTTATASPVSTAILAWDAASATNLSGYRIYYGTAPGTYLQALGQGLAVGNVTTYTVTGLSRGTRYYFAVTAFDSSNKESTFSTAVFKDIP